MMVEVLGEICNISVQNLWLYIWGQVAEVKKNIETVMGASEYPAAEQTLIHKGKVLKDETTVEANNIAEKSSIAIMKVCLGLVHVSFRFRVLAYSSVIGRAIIYVEKTCIYWIVYCIYWP